MTRFVCVMLAVYSVGLPLTAAEPSGPVAHWPLARDAQERIQNLPGDSKGVTFQDSSALFDGRASQIVVPSATPLQFGKDDFTIALWVQTPEQLDDDLGDLISKYDPVTRKGFQLSLKCNTGVTFCQPNYRQLQFGTDSGTEPKWTDVGRPGNALLAFGLCVHDGQLYAGTCEPGKNESGQVYRFKAPNQWEPCGKLDQSNSVTVMATYNGQMYAGTGKYRVAGSALKESENLNLGGRIFRYDGETNGQHRWENVGELPNTEAVGGMVVYKGKLYASSLYKPAGFFRYDGGKTWTALPVPDGKRVESLGVYNGFLYATCYDGGHVFRFDGQKWADLGVLGTNTQTYSFAVHGGLLNVGTWPSGKVFQLSADDKWEDRGRLGEELEVMGMLVHNGHLYAGTLPLAEVYRFDGGQKWSRSARLDNTPDVKFRRVWTMAQHQGQLFCSALPTGHVHALTTGACVTHDRELPAGWQHVAAIREKGTLSLYVNGKPVATKDAAALDLTNDAPLRIGAGAADFFNGRLRDVQLVRRALSAAELTEIVRQKP